MSTAAELVRQFEALPFAGLDTIVGAGRPLILAPHPDDESLGCGGLIAACCARGTPPCLVIVTDGAGSHPASRSHPPARLAAVREGEARAAAARLGLGPESVVFLGLPDTATPSCGPVFDGAVRRIAELAERCGASVVLAPWWHDPHCDHAATDAMARTASVATGVRHIAYPVWGWTLPPETLLPDEPVAGWRLDIGRHQSAKQAAIAAHRSQYSDLIRDDPDGFRLPAGLLAVFARPYEVFLRT